MCIRTECACVWVPILQDTPHFVLNLSHTYLEERYVEAYVIICLQLLPEHLLAALRVQLVFVLHLWAKYKKGKRKHEEAR